MKKRKYNGDLSILNRDTLMCDLVFMTKALIKEECDCVNKSTCLAIVDLLNNNKLDEAKRMIESMG